MAKRKPGQPDPERARHVADEDLQVTPAFETNNGAVRIFQGDCLEVLRTLPNESVQCCVTSPPYWGLRDYGLPPSVWGGAAGCAHDWQDASWRPDRWGQCDDDTPGEKQRSNPGSLGHRGSVRQQATCSLCGAWLGCFGLERTHELYVEHAVMIFAEVRRVLRGDGTLWLNLGDTYNAYNGGAGPGSKLSKTQTEQRPQLLTGYGLQSKTLKPKDLIGIPWSVAFALRSAGWYLRSDVIWAKPNPMPESVTDRPTKAHEYLFLLAKSERYFFAQEAVRLPPTGITGGECFGGPLKDEKEKAKIGASLRTQHRAATKEDRDRYAALGANIRSVWSVVSVPYKDAHFATFPPDLIRPCILAGCPEGGTVLDPFNGAGTTGLVALQHGRLYVGIELNPDYVAMSVKRLMPEIERFELFEGRQHG